MKLWTLFYIWLLYTCMRLLAHCTSVCLSPPRRSSRLYNTQSTTAFNAISAWIDSHPLQCPVCIKGIPHPQWLCTRAETRDRLFSLIEWFFFVTFSNTMRWLYCSIFIQRSLSFALPIEIIANSLQILYFELIFLKYTCNKPSFLIFCNYDTLFIYV